MTSDQQLGLMAEIGRVFTPSVPINKKSLFAGRRDQLRRILDAVNTPGKHVILYGDRGVGKTSLATILKELLYESTQRVVSRVNCEAKDTFPSVWDKALAEIPVVVEGENGNQQYRLNQWLELKEYIGAGQIRRVLQSGNEFVPELIIVFDEFDRLGAESRGVFADTIKDLADSQTFATIILVGVGTDVTALISDHASIGRNLAQIKMPPMSAEEVREILDNGLKQLKMTMTSEAYTTIVTLAQGYPHYAHLLAKEASLTAVDKKRFNVVVSDVTTAIQAAIQDVGYNIADAYHRATLAQRKGTLFEQVLVACALATVDELGYFSSTDVKPALAAVTGRHYEIYGFSQHLERFATEDSRGPVLEKRGTGRCYRYRFIEPLLRPYAIIKGMAKGIVTIDMLKRLDNQEHGKSHARARAARPPKEIPTPKQHPTTPEEPNLFGEC